MACDPREPEPRGLSVEDLRFEVFLVLCSRCPGGSTAVSKFTRMPLPGTSQRPLDWFLCNVIRYMPRMAVAGLGKIFAGPYRAASNLDSAKE